MFKTKLWVIFLILVFVLSVLVYSQPVFAQESNTNQFYETILASNLTLPIGRVETTINSSCTNLIDRIVKCPSGNGTCVENIFKSEDVKNCVGASSVSLNDDQKSKLINQVCLALPASNTSDKIFFCQACIGRGVNPGWDDRRIENACNQALSYSTNNANTPRKLVKRVVDNNGQVKEVLATRINVKEKYLGVAQALEDNFYLKVANQLANPFVTQLSLALANAQNQSKTLIIEASGISNLVPGVGIEKSNGERCDFSFFPGNGWKVVAAPFSSLTNSGTCSTEVTIEPVITQTAFWSFGETPVWAQGQSGQPSVQLCIGQTCASDVLNLATQVVSQASTNILNFFQDICFFPGQVLDNGTVCSPDKALSVRMFRAAITIAPIVVFVVALIAGFLLLLGKEEKGRSLLEKAIKSLIMIFIISAVVGLIEQSIQQNNTQPITNFVTTLISNLLIPLASILSLVFFVVGAYYVMVSGDNEERIGKGWKYMKNAVIGFVIVLLSFSMAQVVINLFKIINF